MWLFPFFSILRWKNVVFSLFQNLTKWQQNERLLTPKEMETLRECIKEARVKVWIISSFETYSACYRMVSTTMGYPNREEVFFLSNMKGKVYRIVGFHILVWNYKKNGTSKRLWNMKVVLMCFFSIREKCKFKNILMRWRFA